MGWGGEKGKEKTLKSFKRISVNSSKTSLCDVSQSIVDQIEERIATVNPLLSIPTMGINTGTKHTNLQRIFFFSFHCTSRTAVEIRVFLVSLFPGRQQSMRKSRECWTVRLSVSLCNCRDLVLTVIVTRQNESLLLSRLEVKGSDLGSMLPLRKNMQFKPYHYYESSFFTFLLSTFFQKEISMPPLHSLSISTKTKKFFQSPKTRYAVNHFNSSLSIPPVLTYPLINAYLTYLHARKKGEIQ